jgi:hypothetical protein
VQPSDLTAADKRQANSGSGFVVLLNHVLNPAMKASGECMRQMPDRQPRGTENDECLMTNT